MDGATRDQGLQRALQPRHLSMLALGGTIGAGLFVGSGAVLASAGPAGVLSYALGGLVVVVVMRVLAELVLAHPDEQPITGHVRRAVGPGAAYAVGWLYWWGWVVALAFEAVAGGAALARLVPAVPLPVGALALLVPVVVLNLRPVRSVGEAEYWLAALKVLAIVAFLVVGVLAVSGLLPGRDAGAPGLDGQPLLPGGWAPVVAALVAVLFTYGGTEIVAIAAAEAQDPARALVRATRQVVGRILLFYVGSTALIVALLPAAAIPTDASPFAAVLDDLGVPAAGDLLNLVVLVALLSAMNGAVYVSSRTLHGLARDGDARARLGTTDAAGVPRPAVLVSAAVALLACLVTFVSGDGVFLVLLGTAGAISLPVYGLVVLAHVRLRRERERRGAAPPAVRVWLFPHLSHAVLGVLVAAAVCMAVIPDFRAQLVLTALVFGGLAAAHRRRAHRASRPAR